MRQIVYEALRQAVDERVKNVFPQFEADTRRVRQEPRRLQKYVWKPSPRLSCYIAFRGLESEAIDALAGWTTLGKFPITEETVNVSQDIWDFDQPYVLRFSIDLAQRHGSAAWNFWEPSAELLENPEAFGAAYGEFFTRVLSADEAKVLVMPAVEQAVQEVHRFCLPYLLKRAEYEFSTRGKGAGSV